MSPFARCASLFLFALSLIACGPVKPVVTTPPKSPEKSLFVLLPDAESKVGSIAVSTNAGSRQLKQAREAVQIESIDQPPPDSCVMQEAEVAAIFGDLLAAEPPAPLHFILYFAEGRDELDQASLPQVEAILQAIKDRHSTDASIIGHTDTTGDSKANYQLGLRRAEWVFHYLALRGVDASFLEASSRGQSDLLVKTAGGVNEARNRRVEVTVR
jgi:outer membrane protein OmpA-like peptidoglycan-associated protein